MPTLKPSKNTRLLFVAATALIAPAGIAAAQQGTLPNTLPPQNGAANAPVAEPGLRPMLLRVAQYAQVAQTRGSATTTDARTSYSAASRAFGDLLKTLGEPAITTGVTNRNALPQLSTAQAASDIRLLKSAAKRAQSTEDAERFRKAASLYATGAKELVTGQLREALLDDSTETVAPSGDTPDANAPDTPQNPPAPAPNDPNNPTVPPQNPDPENPPQPPGNPGV